ncbi:J domain-containing protein [Dermatobacter hominis]|uniref:J domain-containing protein n=1 Tax=Dermatobacter hominis TaxID=2884263 RepID=UPI001D11FF11|nr:J domain-containing protein [Dermatobacter hominis]UDY35517.1 J domain-containing protein [Dermatobacter hominis]
MRTTDHDDPEGDRTRPVARGVPGGATRLPRLRADGHGLEGAGDGPSVEMVGGGFVEDELTRARRSRLARERSDSPGQQQAAEPVELRFADYSPMESLFEPLPSAPTGASGPTFDLEDAPTRVLGVEDDADWNTIRAAHRKLLAKLHPDRFVTADERTRQDAADKLAAINVAYHELERTRRAV